MGWRGGGVERAGLRGRRGGGGPVEEIEREKISIFPWFLFGLGLNLNLNSDFVARGEFEFGSIQGEQGRIMLAWECRNHARIFRSTRRVSRVGFYVARMRLGFLTKTFRGLARRSVVRLRCPKRGFKDFYYAIFSF